jgi:hypothetical protein
VVAVLVAGAGLWNAHRHSPAPTVSGSGAAACRHLVRALHAGNYVDSRVVDGRTAATWLSRIHTDVDPDTYRADSQVTICVTYGHSEYATYVVGQSGREQRVTAGSYVGAGGTQQTMTQLDRLITGGRSTTEAPFSCAGAGTARYLDVATSLPVGAIAARICYGGGFYSPSDVLTHGLDSLINTVNAAPIEYVASNTTCSGAGEHEFTLVFRYPSGTRSVSQETCRGLALGQYTRSAHAPLERTFMSLLAQQHGATPRSVAAPPCPTSPDRPEGVGDLRNLVAARYCPPTGSPKALTDRELEQLSRWGRGLEFATSVLPENSCPRPTAGWPRLALADAWGNRFTMVVEGCGHRMFPTVVSLVRRDQVTHPDSIRRRPFLQVMSELATGTS